MKKSITKKLAQPSRHLNFSQTLPKEKNTYHDSMLDNPDYWDTEQAYFGAVVADSTTKAPAPTWYEKLINIYGAYQAQRLAQKQQDQLARENAARAAAGKSPLSMEQYAGFTAPQVNVGLSPSTKQMLIYGGVGLGALLLFMIMGKRR